MGKKIEVSVEKIQDLAKTLQAWEGRSKSEAIVRQYFPETFEPEKHPAIRLLDSEITDPSLVKSSGRLREIRSYFNDDGTLKKGA